MGFLRALPVGRRFIAVNEEVAQATKDAAVSIELHARHDELAGSRSHFARHATWGAAPFLGQEATNSALSAHRRANRSKHGGWHSAQSTLAPPAQRAWADLDDDGEPDGLWESACSHSGPPISNVAPDLEPPTATGGVLSCRCSEVWPAIVANLAKIGAVLDTLASHVMSTSPATSCGSSCLPTSSRPPSLPRMQTLSSSEGGAEIDGLLEQTEAALTQKLNRVQEQLSRLEAGLSGPSGQSLQQEVAAAQGANKQVSFNEGQNTVEHFTPAPRTDVFTASCGAVAEPADFQRELARAHQLPADDIVAAPAGQTRVFDGKLVGGCLKILETDDRWVTHWVQSFDLSKGFTLQRESPDSDSDDEDCSEVVRDLSSLYAHGQVRFEPFTDQAGSDFPSDWALLDGELHIHYDGLFE